MLLRMKKKSACLRKMILSQKKTFHWRKAFLQSLSLKIWAVKKWNTFVIKVILVANLLREYCPNCVQLVKEIFWFKIYKKPYYYYLKTGKESLVKLSLVRDKYLSMLKDTFQGHESSRLNVFLQVLFSTYLTVENRPQKSIIIRSEASNAACLFIASLPRKHC